MSRQPELFLVGSICGGGGSALRWMTLWAWHCGS